MAHTIQRPGARSADRSHGAWPVVLFFVAALAVSMFAIGYLAWTAPQRLAANGIELRLPRAPSGAPNPQPLPAPMPRPG